MSKNITLEEAMRAIEASHQKANEIGVTISTAITDEHGIVIALQRMDGALVISPKFAIAKAYTAATLKFPTKDLGDYSAPNKPYFGLTSLFGGELTVIDGGVPVARNSVIVGGVGVGGSPDVAQDEECAVAAREVLEIT